MCFSAFACVSFSPPALEDCDAYPNFPAGTTDYSCTGFTEGSTCTFTCAEGYTGGGNKTCENKAWTTSNGKDCAGLLFAFPFPLLSVRPAGEIGRNAGTSDRSSCPPPSPSNVRGVSVCWDGVGPSERRAVFSGKLLSAVGRTGAGWRSKQGDW